MFKILQYSEMECTWVMKITEGLFRKYSVLKILYTLAGGPLNFRASLYLNPALHRNVYKLKEMSGKKKSRKLLTKLFQKT
jgi:hypothetical protein